MSLPTIGRLFQIGVVVPDLQKALSQYSEAFGLGPWIGFRFTPENVKDFTYRGKQADYSIELAMATSGNGPQIELIQIHGSPSLYQEWTDEHGFGIQHLGMIVEDIEVAKRQMQDAGYDVVQTGRGYGRNGDGAFVYFDTVRDFGFVLEAIQVPAERREPDFVWPAPE